MPLQIEDYALIGDCQSAALVGRDGSVDWLCLPRFDSPAFFAALVGTPEHGRWLLAPSKGIQSVERRYHDDTLVLETRFTTDDGAVRIVDFMPPRSGRPDLVRLVVGERGTVPMRTEMAFRFDYGSVVPWVRRESTGISAIAGPETIRLVSPVELHGENMTTVGEFTVSEGERIPFVLAWHPSHEPAPPLLDAERALQNTDHWWREWVGRCTYDGPWREAVVRSLITLKALTFDPTGGIVAAPTTSLPEKPGGIRNWDYRFCWLRDATFTLDALLSAGFTTEAVAFREWLLRAIAGSPDQVQAVYGVAGERRLTEWEVSWLPGYEESKPVRVGNAAYEQFQLDVIGELMDAVHCAHRAGIEPDATAWNVQRALLGYLERVWQEPDEGIWEIRGPRRHMVHSKTMAWVAFDRAVKAVERFGLEGPVDRWRKLRDRVHDDVCREGYNEQVGAFVQYYGSDDVDAALLMMPLVGFLPADDPRIAGTVDAVQRRLSVDGFVRRYATASTTDGLPPGEGAFLLCSFWLADTLLLLGREQEAREQFERLLAVRNDVGLLAEEYDPHGRRLLGNFPQAFSHVALINTAHNLQRKGIARRRPEG